ncbi:hypothetical protein EWM64_g9869 [Hericium alpestre]|uniref:Uncharacterized protein n=1 Tax=Hericium alpestre TaxID=135208 RepID=A0A4Y9ZJS9_9AGAM|nr:hypothetical protein EWM64_g9869 [Hericium alpestre]
MVSHSVSEGPLSDAAFKGMVNEFLAFDAVVQDPARPAGFFIREQDVASEVPISNAQFERMVRKFTEFGETVRSQAPLEHPFVPQMPNDAPAHPGTEGPKLDATVEDMVDRFQDLEVSGNYFVDQEKIFLVGKDDVQTQFIKIEPSVVGHATSDASDAWKNDATVRESRETGIEESRQSMKGGQTARRNREEGEASTGVEEIPELEECEAESVEYSLTQPSCLSRDETWMRTRRRNHRLHVELPKTSLRDEGEGTVHHFFPDFDYGGHAASQCPA